MNGSHRLVKAVVCNAHGQLRSRIAAVLRLQGALLRGRIPTDGSLPWPSAPLQRPVCAAIATSGLANFCAGDPALADEVLVLFLDAVDSAQRRCDQIVADWVLAANALRIPWLNGDQDWQRVHEAAMEIVVSTTAP